MSRRSVGGGLMSYINRSAIIASRAGPDGLAKARKSRKRRRFIVQSMAAFVISMLVMIVAKQKWNTSILLLGEG
jgi:hypothetical protein